MDYLLFSTFSKRVKSFAEHGCRTLLIAYSSIPNLYISMTDLHSLLPSSVKEYSVLGGTTG